MEKFNLKKFAKSVSTVGRMLDDSDKENARVTTMEQQLSDARDNDGATEATEKLLANKRENEKSAKTIEGQLNDRDVPEGYPQRDGKDKYSQLPINLLAEAREQEQIKATEKEYDKAGSTEFWDRFVGKQLDGEKTTVPAQISDEASQLHNNPARFTGVTEDNVRDDKVSKMVMASLRDADAMLFYIYHTAASQSRELTNDEKELVGGINRDKTQILSRLAKGGHLCQHCNKAKWECSCKDDCCKEDKEDGMVEPIER